MNLQQLRYFITIVKKKNFTKAAEQLHVTQSTLSHSINELERELNAPLLVRNRREVMVTHYGEMLLEYVQPALNLIDEAQQKIKDMTDPYTGVVSISYFSSLNDLITFAISSFYEDVGIIASQFRFHPSSTTEIEESIVSGKCDIAFTTEVANPNLQYYNIGHHDLVVIVPRVHPLAVYDSIDLYALRNEKIITYEPSCQIRDYIDKILLNAGVVPNVIFQTTDDNIIISSVAANFGIALIPKPLAMHTSMIKSLRITDSLPPRAIALAWHKTRYISKTTEAFINHIISNREKLDEYLQSENQREEIAQKLL